MGVDASTALTAACNWNASVAAVSGSGLTAAISSLALQSVSAAALPAGMVIADLTALIGAFTGLELSGAAPTASATAEPSSLPASVSLPLPAIAGAAGAVAAVVLCLLSLLWIARRRAMASRAVTLRALRRSIQRIKGAEALLLRAQSGAPADSAGVLDSLSLGLATDALLPSGSNVAGGKGGTESAAAQQRVAQMLPSVVDSLLGGPDVSAVQAGRYVGAPAAAAHDPENGAEATPAAGGADGGSAEQKQRQQAVRQFAGRMQRGVVADMVQTTLATVAQTLADPVMLRDAIIVAIAAEEVKEAAAAAAAHSAQPDGHGDSGLGGLRGLDATGLSSNHLRQRRSIHAFVPQQIRKPAASSAPALSSQDAVLRALTAAAAGRIQDALAPPQAAGKAGRHPASGGNAVSESDMWALEELEAELLQAEQRQTDPPGVARGTTDDARRGTPRSSGDANEEADEDPSAVMAPAGVKYTEKLAVLSAGRARQAMSAPVPLVAGPGCTPAVLPAAMRLVLATSAKQAAGPHAAAVTVALRQTPAGGSAAGKVGAGFAAGLKATGLAAGEQALEPDAVRMYSRAGALPGAGSGASKPPIRGAAPSVRQRGWASAVRPAADASADVQLGGDSHGCERSSGDACQGKAAASAVASNAEVSPTLHTFHQLLASADAAVAAQQKTKGGAGNADRSSGLQQQQPSVATIRSRFEAQIAAARQRLEQESSHRSGPSQRGATRRSTSPQSGRRDSHTGVMVVAAEEGGEAVDAEQARGMGEGAQVAAQSGGGGAGSFGLVTQDRKLAVIRAHTGGRSADITAVSFNARRTAELGRSASSSQRSRVSSSGAGAADSETEPGGMRRAQQFNASGVLRQSSSKQRLQVLPRTAVEAIVGQALQSAAAVAGQQLLQSLTQADAQTAQYMASVARVRSGGGKGGGLAEDGDLPAAEAALLQRMAAEVQQRRGLDTRSELLRMLRCCRARTAGAKGAAAGAGDQHHSAWLQAPRGGPARRQANDGSKLATSAGDEENLFVGTNATSAAALGHGRQGPLRIAAADPGSALLLQHFAAAGLTPASTAGDGCGGPGDPPRRAGGAADAALIRRNSRVHFQPRTAGQGPDGGAAFRRALLSRNPAHGMAAAAPAAARGAVPSLRKHAAGPSTAPGVRPGVRGKGRAAGASRGGPPTQQQHVNPLHAMDAATALAAAATAAAESAVALSFAAGRVAAAAASAHPAVSRLAPAPELSSGVAEHPRNSLTDAGHATAEAGRAWSPPPQGSQSMRRVRRRSSAASPATLEGRSAAAAADAAVPAAPSSLRYLTQHRSSGVWATLPSSRSGMRGTAAGASSRCNVTPRPSRPSAGGRASAPDVDATASLGGHF
jgi:hypothetical protein